MSYEKYKSAFPNKTDEQCIESLCAEVKDKTEAIHKYLTELELMRAALTKVYEVATEPNFDVDDIDKIITVTFKALQN